MKLVFKKTAFLVVTCVVASAAYAGNNHPATVFTELKTTNPSLTDGNPTTLGEEVGFQQALNKHLYYTLSATLPQHSAYSAELDLGYKTQFHRVLPFAELEVPVSHNSNGKTVLQLDYDFGAAYQLTNKVYPLVAFDSLGLRGQDSVEYGALYQCTPKVSLTVEAVKYLRHSGSSAKLKVGVAL